MDSLLINKIFSGTDKDFNALAASVFDFQYANNIVYRQWCNLVNGKEAANSKQDSLLDIPFMPISFFKSHTVTTTSFEPQLVFESSGTTQTINSKHLVKDAGIYEQSFIKAFEFFYGNIKDWCIIGLLPSYLERNNSSLIKMANELITISNHPQSGFYVYDFESLYEVLTALESRHQKTLLIGVTFALLDFAEQYQMQLHHTVVMETGGMKGRREELTRSQVHAILQKGLGVKHVHSEYGMTELLSQAYSKGEGRFVCPTWMKVLVRDEEDPFNIRTHGKGVLNVIDLANVYSCSFIATEDVGVVYEDGSFEVWGRLDNSDIRGCSLLVV